MVNTRSSITPKKTQKSSEEEDDDFRVVKIRVSEKSRSSTTSDSDSEATETKVEKDSNGESHSNDEEDAEEKSVDDEDKAEEEEQEEAEEEEEEDNEEGANGNEEQESGESEQDVEEEEQVSEDDEQERKGKKHIKEKKAIRPSSRLNLDGFYGFKCYTEKLIIEGKEIMQKFDEKTLGILFKTPFGKFFKAINSGWITTKMVSSCKYSILDVIGKYTKVGNGFKFNNKSNVVEFDVLDVGLIFGMPIKGHEFEISGKPSGKPGRFEKRYLYKSTKRITKTDLMKEVQSLLGKKNKSDEERVDLVKLFILWSFGMFFFCSTNGGVSRIIIRKFENFDYVKSCSWPRIIHSFLMKSMELNKDKPFGVSGCVILFLYFLLEHCDLTDPIKGFEDKSPRMAKWDLRRITGTNWVGWYKRIQFVKVI